jgi:hypothetical protein
MNNLTLNLIKSKSPCEDGYAKLLKSLGKTQADDEPIRIEQILESNGINDTIWVIWNCIKGREMDKRNLLADIAESVLHIFEAKYPDDTRPRRAIEGLRDEKVDREGLRELAEDAAEAARAAAEDAAWAADAVARAADGAAWAAMDAAWAAAEAARAAAAVWQDSGEAEREKQKGFILKWFGGYDE